MREFIAEQGYLTFALNNSKVDYLRLAYVQALSIKCTQKINQYAVIVDQQTYKQVTDQHRRVFDHIIVLEDDHSSGEEWKLSNEWQAFNLTPFRETIKIECDMLFPRSIDHWWTGLRHQEVTFTTQVRDYKGQISTARNYRQVFDSNHLPNVYNGLFYFRHSRAAMELFSAAREIYANWPLFRDNILKNCRSEQATTDEVFAIASRMIGAEQTTNPALDYLSFTHMKNAINGIGESNSWNEILPFHVDDRVNLYVNYYRQQYPFHYQLKDLITDQIIIKYEQRLQELNSSVCSS